MRFFLDFPRTWTRALRLRHAALLLALANVTGCGDDLYPVTVTWVVNGLAPTAEACERYGIERIVLTVRDGAQDRTIEGDCEASVFLSDGYEYGGFVTTDSFDYDVVYPYQVEMVGPSGSAIIQLKGTFSALRGDVTPVELPSLDLLAPLGEDGLGTDAVATITGTFSVGSGNQAEACENAGIERVELWVYSVLDFDFESPARVLFAPCEEGVLDSGDPLLDYGDYQVTYVALTAVSGDDFEVVEESEAISVYVDQAGVLDLPAVKFNP